MHAHNNISVKYINIDNTQVQNTTKHNCAYNTSTQTMNQNKIQEDIIQNNSKQDIIPNYKKYKTLFVKLWVIYGLPKLRAT